MCFSVRVQFCAVGCPFIATATEVFTGHSSAVTKCKFSPDGSGRQTYTPLVCIIRATKTKLILMVSEIAASSVDGTVRIWSNPGYSASSPRYQRYDHDAVRALILWPSAAPRRASLQQRPVSCVLRKCCRSSGKPRTANW